MNSVLSLLLGGLLAGVASGLFGLGGGIVLVMYLVFVAKYDQHMANGTSLVAMSIPVGVLLGAWTYYKAGKMGPMEVRAGLLMAVGVAVGAWASAHLAVHLPGHILRKGYAVFLVLVAFRLWFR